MHKQKLTLMIKCITWGRDSHGLFDYESRNHGRKNLKADVDRQIIRVSNDIEALPIHLDAKDARGNEAQVLVFIRTFNNQFSVHSFYQGKKKQDESYEFLDEDNNPEPSNVDLNEPMYLVIRSLKQGTIKKDYNLKKRDIVKLGRVKFKVKEI